MGVSSFSGPVLSTAGFQIGTEAAPVTLSDSAGNTTIPGNLLVQGAEQLNAAQGGANSVWKDLLGIGAIVDNTATTVFTITIPNGNHSAVLRVLVRTGMTASGHQYDSTRVVEYLITVTRVTGANAVGGISAAIGAQIATVAAGRTVTTALTLAAVAGAVGATNTIPVQVTNVNSVAGTSETSCLVEIINAAASGITAA